MAFCPKCAGEMGVTEGVCSHCGYDFPREETNFPREETNFPREETNKRWGITEEKLLLGDVILLAAFAISAMLAVYAGLLTLILLVGMQWNLRLLIAIVGFIQTSAMFVICSRLQMKE